MRMSTTTRSGPSRRSLLCQSKHRLAAHPEPPSPTLTSPVHVLEHQHDRGRPAYSLDDVEDLLHDEVSHIDRRTLLSRCRPPEDESTSGGQARIRRPAADTEGVGDHLEGPRPVERVCRTPADRGTTSSGVADQHLHEPCLADSGLTLDDEYGKSAVEQRSDVVGRNRRLGGDPRSGCDHQAHPLWHCMRRLGPDCATDPNVSPRLSAIDAVADPDRPDSLPQNALIGRGACGVSRFEMYGDL